jgi:hypothetical protein
MSKLQDFTTRILSWIRVKLIQGKVTRTKTFINLMSHWFRKIAVLRLNLYLFEWFVIIECERIDKYTNVFTKKLSTRNSLNYIHNDRYCNRKKLSHSLSPVVEFSHGAFFCSSSWKWNFVDFSNYNFNYKKAVRKLNKVNCWHKQVIVRIFKEQANILT